MKKGLTELVFILDKSGSMAGVVSDTVGGFNGMIESKKKEELGEILVSTVLFNEESTVLHDRVDIKEIKPLTEREYSVGGCTALIDAIGGAIKHITTVHKYIRKEDCPEKVMFVITTDGMENASRKYELKEVKKMIEAKKELGWEFIFLGANIDAIGTARDFGIKEDRAVNYLNDRGGIRAAFKSVGRAVEEMCCCSISDAWMEEVELDYKKRK